MRMLYSLAHDSPARIDFYRGRVVDGLGHVIHERLFAVELSEGREPCLREPTVLGNFIPASSPLHDQCCASVPGEGRGEGFIPRLFLPPSSAA